MNGTIPPPRTEAQARNGAGQLRGRLLYLVAQAGDQGLTATDAHELYVEAFGEPGVGPSINEHLTQLVRSGHLQSSGLAYVASPAGRAWSERQQ